MVLDLKDQIPTDRGERPQGQIRASKEWLRRQMEEGVPAQLWEKALFLLPQTEPRRLWPFGERR